MFYKTDRLALFIDGVSLHSTAKSLGFEIDYKLLRKEFSQRGRLLRILFYTAISDQTEQFSPVRPLIDWLQYNGFVIVSKPAKEHTDAQGNRRIRSNINTELTVDAITLAQQVDHIVIFSGDGDLRYTVEHLQRMGVYVSVVSSLESQPPTIADELRRQADNFIELDDLRQSIARVPRDIASGM